MKLCFFGAYDSNYPRNSVIRKGLRLNSVEVSECRLRPKYKFWMRYPLLLAKYQRLYFKNDFFFVPAFCQKDVPLVKILSLVTSKRIVFDPLATRYETKITDWKRKPSDSWQAKWNFKIDALAFRFSDLILADTRAHKDYYCLMYGVADEKVAVLPVGYDDELFNPAMITTSLEKKREFTVLFFGSFLPLHGVDCIVKAAENIFSKDPMIRFRLIGTGQTLSHAKAMALNLGLKNIHFDGWLPQTALPQMIAASDICLGIFGKTEKAKRVIPHKIFQAMGMKKPVISWRTPAVEELFSHRENIFLISEPSPDFLAQAILELKEDTVLREDLAGRCHQLVRQNFSPRAIGSALVAILESNFLKSAGRKLS